MPSARNLSRPISATALATPAAAPRQGGRLNWARVWVQPAPAGRHYRQDLLHLVETLDGPIAVDMALDLPFVDRVAELAKQAAAAGFSYAEPIMAANDQQVLAAQRHCWLAGFASTWLRVSDRRYAAGPDPGWWPLVAAVTAAHQVVDVRMTPRHSYLVCADRDDFFDAMAAAPPGCDLLGTIGRFVAARYWPDPQGVPRYAAARIPEGLIAWR